MSCEADDHMVLISQMYPGFYTKMVPQQGESKPRRRRKKNKGGDDGISGMKKRKLTAEQLNLLEMNFGSEHKLESERKDKLASELGLDPRQVAVWFQNRRARWKNKKLEEEYTKLKSAHENIVVENCRLESEVLKLDSQVLKLKEQLSEAQKQIQQLSERTEGGPTNSPSSTLSMEAIEPPFLMEFGMEGLGWPESSYVQGLEWVNLYV